MRFLRRYFRVEAQLWEHHSMLAQRGTGVELAEGFSNSSPIFMRLQRRIAAAEKARDLAREALVRLQAVLEPVENEPETRELASFLIEPKSHPAPLLRSDQAAKKDAVSEIPPESTAIFAGPALNYAPQSADQTGNGCPTGVLFR